MFHKKYRTYYKYMKKCPTNDCKVKKEAAAAKKFAKKKATKGRQFARQSGQTPAYHGNLFAEKQTIQRVHCDGGSLVGGRVKTWAEQRAARLKNLGRLERRKKAKLYKLLEDKFAKLRK